MSKEQNSASSKLKAQSAKLVLVFGTFDLLHEGHLFFLKSAESFGKVLVMVASDKRVLSLKKQLPHHSEEARVSALIKAGFDAKIEQENPINDLILYKPQFLVLGYDQNWEKIAKKAAKENNINLQIVKIKDSHRPHVYKSSIIRKSLFS